MSTSPKPSAQSITRLQVAGAFSLLAIAAIALSYSLFRSPDTPFLTRGETAWITYPTLINTDAIGADLDRVPVYTFVKKFDVSSPLPSGTLEGRALREVSFTLNGRPLVVEQSPASWKNPFRISLSAREGGALRSGRNELRARVANPNGPALLQLSLEGEGVHVATDASWQVFPPTGPAAFAVVADDTRRNPESFSMQTPAELLPQYAGLLLLLLAAAALLHTSASRLLPRGLSGRAPEICLGLVTLYWVALFATKLWRIPVVMGFDAPAHLLYLDFILEKGTLPLPTEGWSSYHPPVFYLLTSGLVALFDAARESVGGRVVYRSVSFLAGLTSVWMTYFVAKRLWPRSRLKTSLAVGLVGLLPMNVYMSSYVSNESLHAAWVSVALLLATDLLLREGVPLARLALLALVLGLGLLTKFTTMLIVPIVVFFLAAKIWLIDRAGPGPALLKGAGVLAGVALVSGWFYLRNYLLFGDPLIWNLDNPGSLTWWEQPGFHSAAYFTGFGESLRHPFFAGFYSFWDGVYSTLWGDGLVAGMLRLATRHPQWNYDLMTLAYPLALPASALFVVGFGRALHACFTQADLRQRVALSMLTTALFTISFSLFYINFTQPFYAQAKAFYALACILPLGVVGALGLSALPEALAHERWWPLRVAYWGWLGTLAGVLALSFLG